MKKLHVITVHSVKGGAGKTTLALHLAKLLAQSGERTCLVDLDISAPGIELAVQLRDVEKRLNDYLLQPAAATDPVVLDDMLGKIVDPDIPPDMLRVVCLSPCGGKDQDQLEDLICYEPQTGATEPRMMGLLKEIEAAGFTYCILDCHPGVSDMSKFVLEWMRNAPARWTPVFVSLMDRPHVISTLEELAYLQGGRRKRLGQPVVVLNRVSPELARTTGPILRDTLLRVAGNDKVYEPEAVRTLLGTAGTDAFWPVRDSGALRTHNQLGSDGVLSRSEQTDIDLRRVLKAVQDAMGTGARRKV